MLSRALGLILALFVLPLAWGRAIEEPASTVVAPFGPAMSPAPAVEVHRPVAHESDGVRPSAAPAARRDGSETPPQTTGPDDVDPSSPGTANGDPCPAGMIHVDGGYCPRPKQVCERWLDDPALPYARCAEYRQPVDCEGGRVHMSYCIDEFEYTPPGEQLPLNFQSFDRAGKLCAGLNKRLCTEQEWNFACEGESMQPYPYGFSREQKCNQDKTDLYEQDPHRRVLRDLRAAAGSYPECASPFGVHDMVGNLDEPVARELAGAQAPFRNALKGGWWMPGRNRCRPATTAHDDYYRGIQVGARCCADVERAATTGRERAGRAG